MLRIVGLLSTHPPRWQLQCEPLSLARKAEGGAGGVLPQNVPGLDSEQARFRLSRAVGWGCVALYLGATAATVAAAARS